MHSKTPTFFQGFGTVFEQEGVKQRGVVSQHKIHRPVAPMRPNPRALRRTHLLPCPRRHNDAQRLAWSTSTGAWFWGTWAPLNFDFLNALATGDKKNYFTSSDPHHDMLGGGCQVRVVIENMMGRMENLRTLISGFLGFVILVRWALVTMFLSWTTQTGCRIHRTYVSLIGSGEGRHTTHLLKCVLLLSTSQTHWKQSSDVLSDISFDILSDISSDISSDILSDISSDILSDIFLTYLLTFFLTNLLTLFLTYLLTFFLTYLSTCFLTYLLTFFLTYQNQNLTSTASHKKPLCKLYIYLTPRSKSNIHDNFVPVNVIALSASDRPATRQLSPKMQNACSSTHTHTPHASDRPAKRQLSPKMQKSLKCHNYISWRVQTMKSDARHCGSSAGSA